MKRVEPALWWVVYALCALVILWFRSDSALMLEDSDTVGIMQGIRDNPNWLSWFSRDWPLGNHFYRPVSTIPFVLDQGGTAARFGFTNAGLVALSVLGLGWVSRQLATLWRTPELLAAPILFTVWCLSWGYRLVWPVLIGLLILTLMRRDWRRLGLLLGASIWLGTEISGLETLYGRMLAWIPGRTASTMTVFFLPAVALTVAYWRRPYGGLLVGASLMAFLALGSYEQAVMLLPILGALWFAREERGPVHWRAWVASTAAVTVGYLAIRLAVIPRGVSGYQSQQLITGTGGFYALAEMALRGSTSIYNFISVASTSPFVFLLAEPYRLMLTIVGPVFAIWFIATSARWRVLAGLWAASVLAFAPMAFFHQFEHYYFLPMAFRAMFVCAVIGLWLRNAEGRWDWRSRHDGGKLQPDPGAELEPVTAART